MKRTLIRRSDVAWTSCQTEIQRVGLVVDHTFGRAQITWHAKHALAQAIYYWAIGAIFHGSRKLFRHSSDEPPRINKVLDSDALLLLSKWLLSVEAILRIWSLWSALISGESIRKASSIGSLFDARVSRPSVIAVYS